MAGHTAEFDLAKNLSLPVEAMTETIAILAQKGFGKTYTAQKLAEEMYKAGGQIIVLDPVGKWWCLRLAADGKTKWSDIPIFGGLNADFPLPPDKGAFIADVLVDHHTSAVLDVSDMTEGEKKRFVADFATRLKERKAKEPESVVHLFIEEAQEFIPQKPAPDEARMLGALVRIAKLGRNWGVGLTMISQRPQAVSKEGLNLASMLIVGCMVAKHDRKAIEEWVDEQGKTQEAQDLLDRLPKLQKGEMVVWSPSWLDFLSVVHISKKETFDASATPTLGKKHTKFQPKPINAEELKAAMVETEEKYKSEDPSELKKVVKSLRHELQKAQTESIKKAAQRSTTSLLQKDIAALHSTVGNLRRAADAISEVLHRATKSDPSDVANGETPPLAPAKAKAFIKTKSSVYPGTGAAKVVNNVQVIGEVDPDLNLIGKSKLILQHLHARAPDGYDKDQLAILVGMSSSAGGFNNYLGMLRKHSLIETMSGELYCTSKGALALQGDTLETPTTKAELVEMWMNAPKMVGKTKDILKLLTDGGTPVVFTKEEIAAAVSMDPNGGGFNNYMGVLRSAKLMIRDGGGYRAADALFQ